MTSEEQPTGSKAKGTVHDTLQSIGVVFAIGLGLIGAWPQIFPKKEKLEIGVDQRVEIGVPAQFRMTHPLPQGNHTLGGPVVWRIPLTNQSDKTISIVSAEFRFLDDHLGEYLASGADSKILDEKFTEALPLNIPAGETRAVFISSNIPMWIPNLSIQAECLKKGETISNIEACFIKNGLDIFGNKLTVFRQGDRVTGATWPTDQKSTALKMRLKSGSGNEYAATIHYYPYQSLMASK